MKENPSQLHFVLVVVGKTNFEGSVGMRKKGRHRHKPLCRYEHRLPSTSKTLRKGETVMGGLGTYTLGGVADRRHQEIHVMSSAASPLQGSVTSL